MSRGKINLSANIEEPYFPIYYWGYGDSLGYGDWDTVTVYLILDTVTVYLILAADAHPLMPRLISPSL